MKEIIITIKTPLEGMGSHLADLLNEMKEHDEIDSFVVQEKIIESEE